MVWDYCESNPFSSSSGNWMGLLKDPIQVIGNLPAIGRGVVAQDDARRQAVSTGKVVSTDPPYFDNIEYADLSEFFYVWLRRSLRTQFPDLFMTITTPKARELVASPFRHRGKGEAEKFFLEGMSDAVRRLADQAHSAYPVTIYYAFKQSERKRDGETSRTGWETFLEAVIKAGFSVTGTWPTRTERGSRLVGLGTNALASSIVLVCRRRSPDAGVLTRGEFRKALATELPAALRPLQAANIAPVDLAQAAIGPGMAIYTRYARVVYPSGEPLSVRTALQYINEALGDAFEGEFDADTRWALAWFEEHHFGTGPFGQAEVLATAKNVSVAKLIRAGVVKSVGGSVRLLRPEELPADWHPDSRGSSRRSTVWEKTHHLLRVYKSDGEIGAAEMLASVGLGDDTARDLAYSVYLICDGKKWTDVAFDYNALVTSWPEIVTQARLKPWRRETDEQLEINEHELTEE